VSEEVVATRRPPRLLLHVGLFLATFLTTTAAGAIFVHGHARGIAPISDGLSYSVPLMMILLSHELGHYFVARYHGVDASLPYFIPLPPFFILGTMGAVIGMRNVPLDRRKLIDIGAAGPLAGLVVAIPVIWYGLSKSAVGPLVAGGMLEGNSILYAVLKRLVTGGWLPDGQRDVYLHPTAWAGWAGLLVTMINLLPIGQLDGGHIASAYFGNRYNTVARRLHGLLPLGAIAVFLWLVKAVRAEAGEGWSNLDVYSVAFSGATPWLVWFVLVAILRRLSGGTNHPPVGAQPLPRSRRALFWVMVLVFLAVFMPVPLRNTLVGDAPPDAPAVEQL
jgi:membrane-associated protease RseP (regulator of RpoE activity)